MIKKSLPFLLLAFVVYFSGCDSSPTTSHKPAVVVSILPQKYFIERIADTLVDIIVMVPPGSSPETYEPTSAQLKMLNSAWVYFSLGLLDFEKYALNRIAQSNGNVLFINLSKDFNLIEGHEHGHENTHGHGYDPHVWLSPAEVRIMVNSMNKVLTELFPMYDSVFNANTKVFIAEIDNLHSHMQRYFLDTPNKKFFIFHPVCTYLARDYNLVQVALEEDGKSPSLKYMKSVLEDAKAIGMKTVFIQREFDANMAKTMAQDIEGEVVIIDPLEYNWLDNMYLTADLLKNALHGK